MKRKLVKHLRAGVQYERYGDMEPDIYDANETMKQGADRIEVLEGLLGRVQIVGQSLPDTLCADIEEAMKERAE